MKIIQTNKAYFPKVGGIETTVTTLSEGLANIYGCNVKVLTCNHRFVLKKNIIFRNNVEIKYLPTIGFIYSLPISPSYFFEISTYSGDILHIHEPFPLADLSLLLNKRLKNNFKKIVVWWHSDIIRQKWVLPFYRKYIFEFLDTIDRIIISNPNLIYNSEFLMKFRDKCSIIPIGVDLNWALINSDPHINDKKMPLILSVGRLVYYKGFDYLIEAMKYVENAQLLIIGSGPLEKKLKKLIKRLKLNNKVSIIPEVDKETLHSYYKKCDIFVLPSIAKSETFGIVQIEAMACGKPIISTEIGTGTTFVNIDGLTGLVVPPRDSNALAKAINYLLNDSKMREEFQKNARQRAFNEFESKIMVKRVYELYKQILG